MTPREELERISERLRHEQKTSPAAAGEATMTKPENEMANKPATSSADKIDSEKQQPAKPESPKMPGGTGDSSSRGSAPLSDAASPGEAQKPADARGHEVPRPIPAEERAKLVKESASETEVEKDLDEETIRKLFWGDE